VSWPRLLAPAALAGVAVFLSLPPLGLWPLGLAGLGLWCWRLRGLGPGRRALCGSVAALGLLVPGLFWIHDFTGPGYPIAVVVEAAFYALAALATPPGWGGTLAFGATLAGAEMLRDAWPFGGVPVADIYLGQVGGPLAELARLGGAAAVTLGAGLAGAGLAGLARHRWRPGVAALAVAAVAVAGAALSPDGGGATRLVRVAAVQGGGPRGLRAVNRDPALVLEAQVAAEGRLRRPVDLVVWPENVVELAYPLAGSVEEAELSSVARAAGASFIAGVTQPAGPGQFLNQAVAWAPSGRQIGSYEKVHRVPFGEWVPMRSFLRHFADLSVVPNDAVPGHGPGLIRTPAGPLGLMVSWEVFFDERALAAVGSGARLLVVPTNAASYRTDQVPAMEVAAARLRAIATGRDLVQSAPTGYSALVDHRGRLLARSGLGGASVVEGELGERRGRTPYDAVRRAGPEATVAVLVAAAWALAAAEWRRSRHMSSLKMRNLATHSTPNAPR